jgi:hypothetical protein
VRERFQDKVLFIVLYQREAHPGQKLRKWDFENVKQPETYEERLALAHKSCEEMKIATLVVIDNMENTVREAYGKLPNSAYFIERGGTIHYKEAWARPDEWGPKLEKMLKKSTEE